MENENKMPWEMDLGIPTNVVTSLPDTATQQPTESAQARMPWEMDLGAARIPVKTPKAAKPIVTQATPADWAAINQQYAAGQGQRDADRLFTLQAELAKEKDPANRRSLQREISRVTESNSSFPGMIQPGNIDLAKRPVVRNKDGTISTVRSIGVNVDGQEVLIPTVSDDGRILSDSDAIAQYKKTGKHLGKFNSPETSNIYAEKLHIEQERMYAKKR